MLREFAAASLIPPSHRNVLARYANDKSPKPTQSKNFENLDWRTVC